MVLPIGFFMPLPLAMMIPFMGIQSAVMAKQFGENFQYGKRRISAMSNEEFNRLTPKILMENANAELKSMIPSMEQSIKDMSEFQTFLIGEFIKMIGDMLAAGLGKVLGIEDIDTALQQIEHFLHGHGGGHGTEPPVVQPPPVVTPPPGTPTPFPPGTPPEFPRPEPPSITGHLEMVTFKWTHIDSNRKAHARTGKFNQAGWLNHFRQLEENMKMLLRLGKADTRFMHEAQAENATLGRVKRLYFRHYKVAAPI